MHALKHLIEKKNFSRRINKIVFMQKVTDNFIIKTKIFRAMHEKFDHKRRNFIKKSQQDIFNSKSCETLKII